MVRRMRGIDLGSEASRGRSRAARAAATLGLASVLVSTGVGCNAVLRIDEAELCSGPTCADVPAFAQGSTKPTTPLSTRGSDAGASDAGPRAATPRPLAPAPRPPAGSGGGAGSEGSRPANGSGGSGNAEEPGAGASFPPDDDPGSDGSGVDDEGASGNGNGSSDGNGDGSNDGDDDGDGQPAPPTPCTGRANEVLCDGVTRVSCGPDGRVSGSETCASAAHCAQGNGPSCAACLAGEARCEGATLLSCNTARSGLDAQDCGGAALCNAAQARCDAAACEPGSLSCQGAVLQRCNATSTGFDPLVDCGAPEACNAATGSCNVCTPGARRCLDQSTVMVCDAAGQAETPQGCGLLEVCSNGQCVIGLSL